MTATMTTRDALLSRLGEPPDDPDEIYANLRETFGEKYTKKLARAFTTARRSGSETPIYNVLWQNPETALASFHLYTTWADRYFEYSSEHPLPEGDLLDFGSGPGILTCLHAAARPDRQVVGVDFNPKAVACATQLAAELGLDNVTFERGDITTWRTPANFDVITSTAVRQILGFGPCPCSDPWCENAGGDTGPGEAYARTVAAHLKPGGTFRSFERIGNDLNIDEWATSLTAAGLTPVTRTKLEFWGGRDTERMPLLEYTAPTR